MILSRPARALCILGMVVCALVQPVRVNAQWVTWDPGNNVANFGSWMTEIFSSVSNESTAVSSSLTEGSTGSLFSKEYILDQIAYILATEAKQSLIDSVVDWSGTGFDGSPSFVTNIEDHMRSLGDSLADDFVAQLTTNGSIESPFRDSLAYALEGEYYRSTGENAFFDTNQFTLDQYSSNPEAFYQGDFSQGGIQAFMQAFINPQNNPYGAYERAGSELSRQIRSAQTNRSDELNRGDGFLSFCEEPAATTDTTTTEGEGETAETEETSLSSEPVGGGPDCQTTLPGSVIVESLNKVLGSTVDQYTQADELNEVVGVLIGALIDRVLTEGLLEAGSGEAGRNRPVESAPDIINNILNSARSTRTKVAEYQTNWQKIGAEAQKAKVQCSTSTLASQTVDKAAAAALKSADALAALDEIIAKLTALQSGPVQSEQLREVTTAYNSLVMSGRLPNPAEMNEAKLGAVDTPPADSRTDIGTTSQGSLLDQMQKMAGGICPVTTGGSS